MKIVKNIAFIFFFLTQGMGCLHAQNNNSGSLSAAVAVKNYAGNAGSKLFSYQNNVFIKEEGQFEQFTKEITKPIGKDKILFGVQNKEFTAFFTKEGIAFQYPERKTNGGFEEKDRPAGEAGNEIKNEEGEEKKNGNTIWHTVYLKFIDNNADMLVVPTEKVSHYFNFDKLKGDKRYDLVPAYKKLLCQNIYANIDIEFELPEEGGIKYQIILHPGAKISDIKMKWEGFPETKLDKDGNLHLKYGFSITEGGKELILIDKSPSAFKTKNNSKIPIKYNLQKDNIVQFSSEINEVTEETIIDPWIVNPNYPGVNRTYEIQEDTLGNVYTLGNYSNTGSGNNYWIQKYDPTGVLIWTYQTYSIFLGDIAVDKPGNVYYCGGYSVGKREKLNTAGLVQWSLPGLIEEWRLAFNYNKTILIIGGYFLNPGGNNLAQLDVNTGAISNQIVYNLETRAIAAECNGDIYSMHVTFSSTPGNAATNILNKTSAAFTPLASASNGYSLAECETGVFGYAPNPDYSTCIYHGINGLTIIGPYVYTYDGATLKRFNKNSLALVGSVAVPGSSYMQCSGIASDLCGNVFVGTTSGIARFDSTMNYLGSSATPGAVYDIILGVGKTYLLVSGAAFEGNFTGPCISAILTASATTSYSCNSSGSATVTASGGLPAYSYLWIPSGKTTVSVSGLAVGTHTYIVTDSYCQTFQGTVTIVPSPPLTSTISFTGVSCNGGSNGTATMTPSGAISPYTYIWSNAQTTQVATGLSFGPYSCTVTSADSCMLTLSGNVTEPTAVTATQSQTNALCNGATGSATVTPSGGTPGYNYLWMPSGGNAAIATGLSAGINYTCTITDLNSCVNTQTITITQPSAVSATQAQTNVLCNGGTGSATVTPSGGTPGYTFSWLPSGGNAATATGLIAGNYTCVISDLNACTNTQTLTISQPTAVSAVQSQTNILCNGGTGSATVTPSGGVSGYTYTWSPSGGNAANAIGLLAGNYQVLVSDANNCSSIYTYTITQPPLLTISASATPATICFGSSTTLSCVPTGGVPLYTFNWNPGNLIGQSQTLSPLSSTVFTVQVTDANACVNSATVNVTVNPLPVAIANSNSPVCSGNMINLSGSGGTSYTWNGPGGYNASMQNPSIPNATVSMSGTYSLSITDNNNCASSTTTQVTVNPLPVIPVSSATICTGNSTTITATGAISYTWSTGANTSSITVSPSSTTSYSVVGTDANTCTSFSTGMVLVNPLPVITVNSATICAGSSTNLTATGAITYTWSPTTGLSSNQGAVVTASPAAGFAYMVTGTDINNCVNTGTCAVTVNPLPNVIATPQTTSGCEPLCVSFTNAGTSGGTCTWDFGDGKTANSCIPTHCFTSAGTFSVSLQLVDANGCVNTSYANAVVYPLPVADFNASPQPTSILDPDIHFYDASTMANVISWNWNFGDGITSLLQSPTNLYKDTGTYAVQLVVTSDFGCKDSIIKYIIIDDEYMIYVPNAFTPNFDGTNDVFMPKGTGITDYKLYIYDRWGMLVFSSTDQQKGWDGRIKGTEIVQEDVYVWKLELKNKKGTPKLLKGIVSLLK